VAPGDFFASYVYGALAMVAAVGAIFVTPRDRRSDTTTTAVFALAAFVIATWQIRGLTFALLFAMPGLAAFAVYTIGRLRLREAWAAIAFVVSLFASSGATYAFVANQVKHAVPPAAHYYEQQEAWQKVCLSPKAMAPLAKLAPGRVLAFVDQGPAILAYTRHSTLAGPYHRNSAGILDTYAAFTGTPADAARIVAARKVDYVMVCPSAPDFAYYNRQGGESAFAAALADAHGIAWLAPVPAASGKGLLVYRVLADRLAAAP
jgi:hypothetical protein